MIKKIKIFPKFAFFISLVLCIKIYGEQNSAENQKDTKQEEYATDNNIDEEEELQVSSATTIRHFHTVLDELLAEFGYDVKLGQINGLKNIAVRKVEVSDSIPATYQKYLELLIEEKIRDNSQTKIIHCVPCQSKTSRLIEGKLFVTSPSTNAAELKTAATQLGIENFLDIVLVYHTTHMVLGFQIFNSSTSETIWAKTYNSETIKTRYQKLAIDYSQIKKARPGEDYVPEYKILFGLGGADIPNVGGTSNDNRMLDLALRSMERFDNRHSEFGMAMSIFVAIASILPSYPATTTTTTTTTKKTNSTSSETPEPQPFSTALGLFGLYSHNFIGSVESYNTLRHSTHFGAGVIVTSGFIAPTLKFGWDMYFGRRFVATISGLYVTPSSIILDQNLIETKGGLGGEFVLSFNF